MPAADPIPVLCPDLDYWPLDWHCEQADVAFGARIVAYFKPFLRHLLSQSLTPKTLMRHRDHLHLLGGEIIRRRHEDPGLRGKSVEQTVLQLVDDDCGPLIWPRITEQQQNAFDATCRKLYRFLRAPSDSAQKRSKTTHRFR